MVDASKGLACDERATLLESAVSIKRELQADHVQCYRIFLDARQHARMLIDTRVGEITVAIVDPLRTEVIEVESPSTIQFPTRVSLVSERSGTYHVQIRPAPRHRAGAIFEIQLTDLRVATSSDVAQVNAQRLFIEAESFRKRATPEALDRAIELYDQSAMIWRTIGERAGEADGQAGSGAVYDLKSAYANALEHYNRVLLLRQATNDNRGLADVLTNIGGVYWSLGESEKALGYYDRALAALQTLEDNRLMARTLHNIALAHNSLGQNQKAVVYYERALPLRRAVGNRRGEAITLSNMGLVYNLLGEKQLALNYLSQALPIRQAIGDSRGEAYTLTNIGFVYYSLGEYDRALGYYLRALPLNRTSDDRRGEASTLHSMGAAYDSLGEPAKALDHYRQALSLRRAIVDRRGQANTLTNIGFVHYSLGEYDEALEQYGQALTLTRLVGDRAAEAYTLTHLGLVHYARGEYGPALEGYAKALNLRRAVHDRRGEAVTLFGIANVHRKSGNLHESLAHIEAAVRIVDSLRTNVAGQELRASYFGTMRQQFEFYVDLLMQLHQLNPEGGYDAKAFEASERARARTLIDILTETGTQIREGASAPLIQRERSLRELLDAKSARQSQLMSTTASQEHLSVLSKEIEDLSDQLREVEAKIRASTPKYSALMQPPLLGVREIQQQVLDTDTVLLEYALGESRSFLWAVGSKSISAFELPSRATIESAARRLYDLVKGRDLRLAGESQLQRKRRLEEEDRQYAKVIGVLSEMLVGPVASIIEGKRLAIVSDGALEYVPFAALPEPQGRAATEEDAPAPPLVVGHGMVRLPSASVLAVLRRDAALRTPAPKTVAVLADPVFDPDDARVTRASGRGAANRDHVAASRQTPTGTVPADDRLIRAGISTNTLDEGRLFPGCLSRDRKQRPSWEGSLDETRWRLWTSRQTAQLRPAQRYPNIGSCILRRTGC
jgi:tetratricopeptide (TPR) repeat protein